MLTFLQIKRDFLTISFIVLKNTNNTLKTIQKSYTEKNYSRYYYIFIAKLLRFTVLILHGPFTWITKKIYQSFHREENQANILDFIRSLGIEQ